MLINSVPDFRFAFASQIGRKEFKSYVEYSYHNQYHKQTHHERSSSIGTTALHFLIEFK